MMSSVETLQRGTILHSEYLLYKPVFVHCNAEVVYCPLLADDTESSLTLEEACGAP